MVVRSTVRGVGMRVIIGRRRVGIQIWKGIGIWERQNGVVVMMIWGERLTMHGVMIEFLIVIEGCGGCGRGGGGRCGGTPRSAEKKGCDFLEV